MHVVLCTAEVRQLVNTPCYFYS